MAEIDEQLEDCGMENADVLMEIQDMALKRASAVDVNLTPWTFDRQLTVLQKLINLKNMVYSLAPKFVNMDYPYWELNWSEFPKTYSTSYSRNNRDDLADDEEHAINVLPQVGCSFDDESMELYRKFLKNLVYWLRKFRYVKSDKSYTDKTFQRKWEGVKRWDSWTGEYKYDDFMENGNYYTGSASEFARLMSSQEGYLYRDRVIDANPSLSVYMGYNSLNENRYHDHTRNGPLIEVVQEDRHYQITNVPHNLITSNPTCYQADVYWYLVPKTNAHDNSLVHMIDHVQVTDVEVWTTYTWGDQNQFTETNYNPTRSERIQTDYVGRNMTVDKEYEYQKQIMSSSPSDTHQIKLTRWSKDGERSYVYEDTTTHGSSTPWSRNNMDDEKRMLNGLGKITVPGAGSHEPPRFLAGSVSPHETLTYNLCEMDALPAPPEWPSYIDPGGTFVWGVDKWCSCDRNASCEMYPILDFGDFTIPDPEEEEQQG